MTDKIPTSATVLLRTKLMEIVARMRQYAPSLRGVGMTASDASYNRTLQDAAYIDANIKHITVGHDALEDAMSDGVRRAAGEG